MAQIVGL